MIRIDNELVNRKLFETRTKAKEALISGIIFVNGKKITKAGTNVSEQDNISIIGEIMPYVSKGGLKLEKAIKCFGISLSNKIMLDIGSSTGGFSDFALKNNVEMIFAVDVGTNQLHPSLRNHKKIKLYEQTDFRKIDINLIMSANIAVIDLSFISQRKILNKLSSLINLKEIITLIKPQFECGKEYADKYKGIVLDKNIHETILKEILLDFKNYGFFNIDLTYSPILGGSGNIEYLAYFKTENIMQNIDISQIIDEAFLEHYGKTFNRK